MELVILDYTAIRLVTMVQVEQQGRLMLHLHTILWIKNALLPQEIQDKLMSNDCEFQQNLIQYLEGCQKGEFFTGSMEYVKSKIPMDIENWPKGIHTILQTDASQLVDKLYQDLTLTLPEELLNSSNSNNWWSKFYDTVDDILLRSNVHKCSFSRPEKSKFKAKGCLNRDGICKAQFPRPVVLESTVNTEDGYINLKKIEPMLNTISPCTSYLFRCNMDVTSLLSGTSIKAVISYVTDYIAKPSLKNYQIFATAYNVFERNANLELDDNSQTDNAWKLILKIVNALSSKMEIGSPMASMYLLQNPDHYTSHKFILFWWKSFVNDITRSETSDRNMRQDLDIDIKMEDVLQEEILFILGYSGNKNFDDCDINVDIEVTSQEGRKEFQFVNNGEVRNLKMYLHDIVPTEFHVESSPLIDMAMDVDDPSIFLGGGPDIFQGDVKSNSQFIYQGVDGDQDQEDDLIDDKLLITQDGREYVGSSKVNDYKYLVCGLMLCTAVRGLSFLCNIYKCIYHKVKTKINKNG